ncbi:MAG TPA: SymE family type I addiction module toxin [Bacteroidia bacterium]|jgi:toxic protein SymE|nr:SymE family type I addiction module toxin [Bacteroidia bacterium]
MEENNKKKTRKLKVYTKCLKGPNGRIVVPEIKLCGRWLRKYGFKQGQSIMITCEENKITIMVNDFIF